MTIDEAIKRQKEIHAELKQEIQDGFEAEAAWDDIEDGAVPLPDLVDEMFTAITQDELDAGVQPLVYDKDGNLIPPDELRRKYGFR